MAITVNEKLTETWYTPKSEKKVKNKAQFLLSPLDGMQTIGLEPLVKVDDDFTTAEITPEYIKALINCGLKDWKNINGSNGKSLKFKIDRINNLPAVILLELATEIMNRSSIDENERKN